MITPHVRPDTDTYHFAVTQPTLASETFPAGADHCVTEPYRGAAPRRRTRAPVGPRPAGRPGPCHRGSTLRVADAVAAHLSGWQAKSAPTTRVNDVLACRPVRCADSRDSDRKPATATSPYPRPGRRIPGHRRRMRRLFRRTLPRKSGFVGASSGPPPAGTLRSCTRRHPPLLSSPDRRAGGRQAPQVGCAPSTDARGRGRTG